MDGNQVMDLIHKRGKVTKVHVDGTYDIQYDDGTTVGWKTSSEVQLIKSATTTQLIPTMVAAFSGAMGTAGSKGPHKGT
jgi:hypothetical protein